jgi:hypothetical protein
METHHGAAAPPGLARFLHLNGRRCGLKTSKTTIARGLCATCDRAGVCTFPNRNGHAVQHCLEFEEASMEGGSPAPRAWHMTVATGIGEVTPSPVGGLCATCDLSATCTYPRGPQGSLFCEEYR